MASQDQAEDEDQICRSCSTVQFANVLSGHSSYAEAGQYDLFWNLAEVVRNTHCPLCRYLVGALESDPDIAASGVLKRDYPGGMVCGVYAGYEITLSLFSGGKGWVCRYSIQPCRPPVAQVVMPTSFQADELKTWLARCEEEHEDCASMLGDKKARPSGMMSRFVEAMREHAVSDTRDELPAGFRLIDTLNGCIVPGTAESIYFALSYVWGQSQQFTLTAANRTTLEQPRSLFDPAVILPKTIVDALALCRAIGQRYLWVDSLCIIQDGGTEKHGQIGMMDSIFSRAALTIVAGTGENADAGLAPYLPSQDRVGAGRPFATQIVAGHSLVAAPSPFLTAKSVRASVWASRGWTLQEEALSKRAVYFMGDHVLFRCDGQYWAEDFGLGLLDGVKGEWKKPAWSASLIRFAELDRRVADTVAIATYYSALLERYLIRDLTYEDDIINAFQGILTRVSKMKQPHLLGLPTENLGRSLRWTSPSSCPISRREGFPSWSWAGWTHGLAANRSSEDMPKSIQWGTVGESTMPAIFRVSEDDEKGRRGKLKCCYAGGTSGFDRGRPKLVTQGPGAQTVDIPGFQEHHFRAFSLPPNSTAQIEAYLSSEKPAGVPACHILFFWTGVAPVRLESYARSTTGKSELRKFQILAQDSRETFGAVRLCWEWFEAQPPDAEFYLAAVSMNVVMSQFSNSRHSDSIGIGVILLRKCAGTRNTYERVQTVDGARGFPDWYNILRWRDMRPAQRFVALI